MRCLVTGGAGFIGSNLSRMLVEAGHAVHILDDLSTGLRANLEGIGGGAVLTEGSILDGALLDELSGDVELIFHQAASPSVPRSMAQPLATHDVNLTGTLHVLEAARRNGVRRVVLASSSSVYGDTPVLPKVETMPPAPRSPYALHKYVLERYARLYHEAFGLETVCLRYFNVYGPKQRPDSQYAAVVPLFVNAALTGSAATIHGDGGQTRDFTYVADVARANMLAADAPGAAGRVFNVAGGRRISILDLHRVISERVGCFVEPVHTPARAGDVRDSLADVQAAREILGWIPGVPLDEGLDLTIEHFRCQPEGA